MKMYKKIGAFFMLVIMIVAMFLPMNVYATEVEGGEEGETTDSTLCVVDFSLKDFSTDETDNIIFRLNSKERGGPTYEVKFTKENGWKATIEMTPGDYKIEFNFADNKREIELESNSITIPDAKAVKAELGVKKVINNNFLPKFFRNNTFTLILLIVSCIVYYVLKKKRENAYR